MIGMMMLTFILFFAFVVNTGMLVNAKINLQNAADLGAYAGAATQARLLNQISYLNYEMRRQYKKFLFRYYVMGNMDQKPFPRSGGGGQGQTPPVWSPDGSAVNYGAPVVCMVFNAQDNYCQLSTLPKITIPNPNPLDAINSTLISQLQQIESIRQDNCLKIGFTNTTVLRLWLWNSDPDLTSIQNSLPSTLQSTINTIRGLALGIGLVPRELLLRARIDTLKDYVNQAPQSGVTLSQVSQMGQGEDPAASERTIQAFYSAFYTLGEHTFDSGDITMDELSPPSLLQLNDVKVQFDAYAIDFQLGNSMTVNATTAQNCSPIVQPDIIQSPFSVGVSKDPHTMTYYALRLTAKAKILFSPFGDVTLKAYSAAQPFGSRIGPVLQESDFVREDVSLGLPPQPGTNDLNFTHKIPNLPIRATGDSASSGNGWDTQEALSAFYQGFSVAGAQGSMTPTIDQPAMQNAYQQAMVPYPYEGSKYNIPNDLGDSFVHNFDTRSVMAFWAPVFAPAKASQADSAIQGLVQGLIGDAGHDTQASAAFRQALTQELSNYIAKLKNGQGEPIGGANEGFNIAYIQDPLHQPGAQQPISVAGGLSLTDPTKIKTSWDSALDSAYKSEGRVGYSVKFVSFDSLLHFTSKPDGQNSWNNGMANLDSDANADVTMIQH